MRSQLRIFMIKRRESTSLVHSTPSIRCALRGLRMNGFKLKVLNKSDKLKPLRNVNLSCISNMLLDISRCPIISFLR